MKLEDEERYLQELDDRQFSKIKRKPKKKKRKVKFNVDEVKKSKK